MKQLQVVYQDPDILVVHKPAGLPTQSGSSLKEDLESIVLNRLKLQGENPYAALINRLDQPVEGMVLFAKNQRAAALFSRSLQDGIIRKYYIAGVRKSDLTKGPLPGTIIEHKESKQEDPVKMGSFTVHSLFEGELIWRRLEHTLLQDRRTNTSKVVSEGTEGAKCATLCYAVPDGVQGEIVPVLIYLETGRHHQIRVQFAASGMPLVGDRKYAPTDCVLWAQKLGIRTVALCASRLVLEVPMLEGELDLAVEPEGAWYQKCMAVKE